MFCALSSFGLYELFFDETAVATQPPPPVTYLLNVSKVGGDENCLIGVEPPFPSPWHSDSFSEVYAHRTEIELFFETVCPTEYEFDHWESSESDVDGKNGNRPVRFEITEQTWAKAHFVPVTPKATGFSVIGANLDVDTGILRVDTTWTSSSGNLSDLSGQKIFEVIANAPNKSFHPDVREFLCTGLQGSLEKYTFPEPWSSRFGEVSAITKVAGTINAEIGSNIDYLMPLTGSIPQGCTSSCSFAIDQWIVGAAGSRHYVLDDKTAIERGFEVYNGIWHYCINARGVNACVEKTWP